MLYRIHSRLVVNAKQGLCIDGGEGVTHTLGMVGKDKIAVLLRTGAISLVQAPPLDTFEGWAGRARKLGDLGIDTVAFVTLPAQDVAYAIRASVGSTEKSKVDQLALAVERWQAEIKGYLGIGSVKVRR